MAPQYGTPVIQLPILVISCELQSGHTAFAGKNRAVHRTSASQVFLVESVKHRLVNYTHASGLLEVHLQCFGGIMTVS